MQSASLTARSGFLLPLSSSSSRTPPGSSLSSPATATAAAKSLFPDRYHLGGPTSVRHFRLNSLGPKDVGDHLGGDAYYALGASLLTPFRVPALWRNGATRATEGGSWWSNENLKGHVWLNAGKLIGTGTPFRAGLLSLSISSLPFLCVLISFVRTLANAHAGQPFSSLVSTLPSTTVGLGLVYRHSLVRVEANLGVPLVQTRGEGGVKGFQFGLGLSFL